MAGKLALLFLVVFVAAQCSSAQPRVRRDAPADKPTTTTGSDPLDGVKKFFNENLNFDKVVENLKDFGDKISAGTKEFTDNVKSKADELFNNKDTKDAKTT